MRISDLQDEILQIIRLTERRFPMNITDLLPFLLPLVAAQFVLLAITLRHILTHSHYKRGSRVLWLIVVLVGMEFIGPILYFLLGKED